VEPASAAPRAVLPELVEAILALGERDLILDGEVLVRNAGGAFDFAALLSHPDRAIGKAAIVVHGIVPIGEPLRRRW
jgi:hypothetical protein